jgi:hypothetical protein
MTIDFETLRAQAIVFVAQLEGPYKWYIMGAVAFILTALITKFIFKTFKWFLLLVCVVGLMLGGLYLLTSIGTPTNPQRIIDGYLNEEAN